MPLFYLVRVPIIVHLLGDLIDDSEKEVLTYVTVLIVLFFKLEDRLLDCCVGHNRNTLATECFEMFHRFDTGVRLTTTSQSTEHDHSG